MSVVPGHDCIHANVGRLPKGQSAGYTTGSPMIKWTDADWAAHPQGVRICQDAAATDDTADVLDVERGAATNAGAHGWFKTAVKAYQSGQRPGQRSPAIYTSASNVTPLVDALVAGGIKGGCGLWVASWGTGEQEALAEVAAAGGPFPIIGVQYSNGQFYDYDVFSSSWLGNVSVKGAAPPFRHLTAKGDTLASIAASRNMRPDAFLVLQHKLGADVTALASAPLPPGVTWLTVNP